MRGTPTSSTTDVAKAPREPRPPVLCGTFWKYTVRDALRHLRVLFGYNCFMFRATPGLRVELTMGGSNVRMGWLGGSSTPLGSNIGEMKIFGNSSKPTYGHFWIKFHV